MDKMKMHTEFWTTGQIIDCHSYERQTGKLGTELAEETSHKNHTLGFVCNKLNV